MRAIRKESGPYVTPKPWNIRGFCGLIGRYEEKGKRAARDFGAAYARSDEKNRRFVS
jgi:hypothetical protein